MSGIIEAFSIDFLLILAPLFYLRAIKGKEWKEIKKEFFCKYQGHKKEIVGALALFAALLIAFIGIAAILSFFGLNDLSKVQEVVVKTYAQNIPALLFTLMAGVFAEEFFFRAFLVKRSGILVSTIIFTFAHFGYGSVAEIIGVFFLGLILAYWYKKKNSLLQNYFGHMLYNLLAIAIYLI
ncbi:MAG: CPBP family glutamic-type intramembrane protease [archaeon]|jgi:membrane protease YdiL (CAAX protease family)